MVTPEKKTIGRLSACSNINKIPQKAQKKRKCINQNTSEDFIIYKELEIFALQSRKIRILTSITTSPQFTNI